MKPEEFNEYMIQFFEKFGGEGMKILHTLFKCESNIIIYQVMLSRKSVVMSDIPLKEGTVHRSKNILAELGLIKTVGRLPTPGKAGPPPELWQLNLDENRAPRSKSVV